MRVKNIVKYLVNSKEYCSVNYFAKRYYVSPRTICNDIKYIIQRSLLYGFEVLLKRKEGYYINILDEHKLQQFLMEGESQTPIRDHIVVVLIRLILYPDYMTQD